MKKEKIRPVYEADGYHFDSREEMDFYFWLAECRSAGLVGAWSYHPRTFELSPKVTYTTTVTLKTKTVQKENHLLHPCVYTPDFSFMLTAPRSWLLTPHFHGQPLAWVDVKGAFSIHNDDVKFSVVQKWLYQRYKVYINKIVPQKLFEVTFVPRRAAYTTRGALRTCYTSCRTLSAFLAQNPSIL